jgi:hypothetical protein
LKIGISVSSFIGNDATAGDSIGASGSLVEEAPADTWPNAGSCGELPNCDFLLDRLDVMAACSRNL